LDTVMTALGYVKSSTGGDFYHDNFTKSFNNNLTEFTEVFNSTYNATYDGIIANSSINHTQLVYDEWNDEWSASGSSYNESYHGSLNNASYLSTYNATYDSFKTNVSINHTLEVYNEWDDDYRDTYNVTYAGNLDTNASSICGEGEVLLGDDVTECVDYNQTINDKIALSNLSSGGGDFYHDNFTTAFDNNLTSSVVYNNASYLETYNATYAVYNETQIIYDNNASWMSTYNATYDGNIDTNCSDESCAEVLYWSNESILNTNSSVYWNDTATYNNTQMEVNGFVLTILESWLDTVMTALGYVKSSTGGDFYHDNFTKSFNNNLTEFTATFNSTYNETYDGMLGNQSNWYNHTLEGYSQFINMTGTQIDLAQENLTNVECFNFKSGGSICDGT